MKYLLLLLTGLLILNSGLFSQAGIEHAWKFYTPGNTGIMGDYCESVWVDHEGNAYIGGYIPGWEEGGFSKFIHSENRWINYSNVDYPVIGSIYDVGSSRISDIVEDNNGILWMATWRGLLKFVPATGGESLQFWGAGNSVHPGGRTVDLDIAPDGSIWLAILAVEWGGGGLIRFMPATNQWTLWTYGTNANNWPSLIPECEQVAIRDKINGGYEVWVDGQGWNTMIVFDSDTQLFTLLPQNYEPGEIIALPGDDCVDDDGNLWAFRVTTPGQPFSLDYLTPDNTWVTPPQPYSGTPDVWAMKAFGSKNALVAGLNNEILLFNGTQWENKGAWGEYVNAYTIDIDSENNIWVAGTGGAARRDHLTGTWQRYRVTNTSQIDYWVNDMTIDDEGNVWMTGNAAPGFGGIQKFDGLNWTGFNNYTYGLGYPFPFPTDNTEVIYHRPSNGDLVINPMFNYLHIWNGASYNSLNYSYDRSKGVVEDSWNRLWSLGEYYHLEYYNDLSHSWTSVPFTGWGANIQKDPDLPGTIWACSGYEVLRTDGTDHLSKTVEDFPELYPQSDAFSTVVAAGNGIAWIGSNQGLFRLNSVNNTYQFFNPANSQIQGEFITPLAISPDGKLWYTNFGSVDTTRIGLCWFDGEEFGVFPVEAGGLPHAQIKDIEIREITNGYELWISALSRGIAVLKILTSTVSVDETHTTNSGFGLQNYPNPVADYTTFRFSVNQEVPVRLAIYNIQGQMIKNLFREKVIAGQHQVVWDGTNQNHEKVPAGLYIVHLQAGNRIQSHQVIVSQ